MAALNLEAQYQQRLARYVTAMRNEKPDCVPIRPFVVMGLVKKGEPYL